MVKDKFFKDFKEFLEKIINEGIENTDEIEIWLKNAFSKLTDSQKYEIANELIDMLLSLNKEEKSLEDDLKNECLMLSKKTSEQLIYNNMQNICYITGI